MHSRPGDPVPWPKAEKKSKINKYLFVYSFSTYYFFENRELY